MFVHSYEVNGEEIISRRRILLTEDYKLTFRGRLDVRFIRNCQAFCRVSGA